MGVACGTLVLLGLVRRVAALPLVAIVLPAIATTNLSIVGGMLGPIHFQDLGTPGS